MSPQSEPAPKGAHALVQAYEAAESMPKEERAVMIALMLEVCPVGNPAAAIFFQAGYALGREHRGAS